MAIKYFKNGKWSIFPGNSGKDAYTLAKENGYSGSREEYIKMLKDLSEVYNKVLTLEEKINEMEKLISK